VRALFDALADVLAERARPGELLAATLEAEGSEFVRFNGARLRQAGRVERATARLRLVDGERQAFFELTLPGLAAGRDAVAAAIDPALATLREAVAGASPDPLLDVLRDAVVSDDDGGEGRFDRDAFVDTVARTSSASARPARSCAASAAPRARASGSVATASHSTGRSTCRSTRRRAARARRSRRRGRASRSTPQRSRRRSPRRARMRQ
jgi:hypothetical protein